MIKQDKINTIDPTQGNRSVTAAKWADVVQIHNIIYIMASYYIHYEAWNINKGSKYKGRVTGWLYRIP